MAWKLGENIGKCHDLWPAKMLQCLANLILFLHDGQLCFPDTISPIQLFTQSTEKKRRLLFATPIIEGYFHEVRKLKFEA